MLLPYLTVKSNFMLDFMGITDSLSRLHRVEGVHLCWMVVKESVAGKLACELYGASDSYRLGFCALGIRAAHKNPGPKTPHNKTETPNTPTKGDRGRGVRVRGSYPTRREGLGSTIH